MTQGSFLGLLFFFFDLWCGEEYCIYMSKYIIGLGNPVDEDYGGTRHNIGFDVLFKMIPLDQFQKDKYTSSLRAKTIVGEEEVEIILPQTYMNNSGESIAGIENFRDMFNDGEVLVVNDEIDIPFGGVKISNNSGSGGHNGVRSIVKRVGHNNFDRLRIGVAPVINGEVRKPDGEGAVANFVLKKFTQDEAEELDSKVIPQSIEMIKSWVEKGFSETANKFN